ncbi:YfhO family protein [Lentilactobacillus sp. G22-6]|uniref:YfhO family protein n=1 Tax=Lentilactobacillus dabitei TaxID=2831523 RepID=UPI001C27544D|nr:YfhO family protein [Lentilactobacillus dabitei]MBU9788710.1 YfhO family protein [Lentilactobacillus dabitei]
MQTSTHLRKRTFKLPIFLIYTIAFVSICLLTYSIPWLAGRTLIWNVDGIAQHFPILAQFQRILQGTAHQSLFGWSWNLGSGADQLTTFAFYIVGDPFSYLIALFPASKLELGYQLLILLRLYCVGCAFLAWANERSFSRHSKLIGTLIYTFSGYNFYVSMHHPFFLLPMMLFPLLAMGVEKVLHGQNWLPLAIAVALALVSNFYFAYMLALGTFVYLLTRYLHMYHVDAKQLPLGRIIYCLAQAIVTGLMMAGVVLFPTLLSVFQSTRIAYHAKFANGLLLYPAKYYLALPNQLITSTTTKDYWLVLNVCGLTFLAAIYILRHFKHYRALAIVIVLTVIGILLPQVSATTNGLSTPSNRWLFLAVLPLGLATMIFVDQLPRLTRNDLKWLITSLVILIGLVWITKGFTLKLPQNDLVAYGFASCFLLLFACQSSLKLSAKTVGIVLTGLVLINIVSNGQGWFSPNNSKNIKSNLMTGTASQWLHKYYDGAQTGLKSNQGFYRTATIHNYYPHRTAGNNIPMVLGTHDLGAYYSIQDGYVYKFSRSIDNSQAVVNSVLGEADGRTTLLNQLGVRYMFAKTDIVKNPKAVPYGYHFVRKNGRIVDFPEQPVSGLSNHSGTVLLKSNLALPLVYMQNNTISSTTYNQLTPIQREQSLVQGTQVDQPVTGIQSIKPRATVKQVGYTANVFDQHIVETPVKAVLSRLRLSPNSRYRQTAAKYKTTLPKNKVAIWEKATGLNPKGQPLQNVLNKNKRVIARNENLNRNGLHVMDNDAQGRHLSYQLKLKNPEKYRNTELYLVIDGISETRHTMMGRLNSLRADSIIDGTPVSKLQKIDRLRAASQHPDLGGFTVSVQSPTNFTFFRQLPMNNLSDYEDRQHVVLNLGYSDQLRKSMTIHFNGVKQLRFKKVRIMAVPFNQTYDQQIHRLQRTGLQNQKVTNNTVSGETNPANQARIMTTSIPYSSGWKLQVDHHPTKTFVANKGFVGAKIPAGKHLIQLKYSTPGLSLGMKLTIIGFLWLAGFAIVAGVRFGYRKFK